MTGADGVSVADRQQVAAPPAPPTPAHTRQPKRWTRSLVSVAVLAAVFGLAIPLLADYDDAWAAIVDLHPLAVMVISLAVAWNLYTYWPVLTAALPGLRMSEAMVVQQASTAVANTVPAGGAVGMAVTFRMLRAWGFTTQAITRQLVGINMASVLVKLLMPVTALALLAGTGEVGGTYLGLAVLGVVAAVGLTIATAFALRDTHTARRAGASLDRLVARLGRHRHGVPRQRIAPWLLELRDELITLARQDGLRLIFLTVVSHTSLFIVLLVTLRAMGVSEADLDWAVVFAVFAFVRLLSALPITPGGSGIVELGYVGLLTTEAPGGLASQITAAVLLFRALTFVLPIGLGSLAWLTFHSATSWRTEPDSRGQLAHA